MRNSKSVRSSDLPNLKDNESLKNCKELGWFISFVDASLIMGAMKPSISIWKRSSYYT